MRPRICLRYFTRFGINIAHYSSRADVNFFVFAARLLLLLFFTQRFALVNPHFDTDSSKGGQSFGFGEVDHGAQRATRHAPFALPLTASHICPRETTADFNLDTLAALAHRLANRAFDGAAVPDTTLKLLGDVLGDELRVEVGLLNFVHLDLRRLARHLLQSLLHLLDRITLAPDQDAGAGGVDRDLKLVRVALDFDARDSGFFALFLDVAANGEIFFQLIAELLPFGKPAGIPVAVDLQTEDNRVDFTPHFAFPLVVPTQRSRATCDAYAAC